MIIPVLKQKHGIGLVRRGNMADPAKIFTTIKKAFGWGNLNAYNPLDLPTNKAVKDLAMEIASLPTPESTFEANPLVAHHNLSREGVKISNEIGGIPMPSIAISNANSPLQSFGDITLIANPKKIDPAIDPMMYIYGADAFTGRQPKGTRAFDIKLFEEEIKADPRLSEYADELIDFAESNAYDPKEIDKRIKLVHAGFDNHISPYTLNKSRTKPTLTHYTNAVENQFGYWNTEALDKYDGIEKYADVKLTLEPKEMYTDDGDLVPSGPYTAETVLQRMREGQGRETIPSYVPSTELGSKGTGGAFRASFLEPYPSLEHVKANRSMIFRDDIHSTDYFGTNGDNNASIHDVFNAFTNLRYKLADDLQEKYNSRRRVGTNTPFLSGKTATEFIEDLARGIDPRETAAVMNGTIPMEDIPEIMEGIEALRSVIQRAPAEYFEIKPNKVVELSDFSEAVIPKDLVDDQELMDIFKDNGISVSVYDEWGPGMSRPEAIKEAAKAGGHLFSVPIVGTVGYGALQNVGEKDDESGS